MQDIVYPGARYLDKDRCRFSVWAPSASSVELHLVAPREARVGMQPRERGYHEAIVEGVAPGALYFYRLGGRDYPDPASRFQPQGVHGPSQVVFDDFPWQDRCWFGLPLSEYVLYELHVGTFSPAGTFAGILPQLERLRDLGVTALELMPVAQFPGERNWGYDGVYPFAVQNSYGGPRGLKELVDACHRAGLAVVLDVVYNHLGPEGNYFSAYGPYFTDRYRTPWGEALNFDGPWSDEVRAYFCANALYWIEEFHIDALRLDAVHAILDHSSWPFLAELAERVGERAQRLNRRVHLIAESAANQPALIRSRELGGYGLDAQWNDDFHHALRTLLTGEREGYFQDYGTMRHFLKALREGFVYSGEHSAFRRRRHGASSRDLPAGRFVVFAQNHDQVGNQPTGERLTQRVGLAALRLAAAAVLLAPFIPLLFMGEEHAETAPFPYFISHSDPELVEAVRRGRRREFADFAAPGELPDPQAEETFLRAKLRHEGHGPEQRALFEYYRELLRLRRERPALARPSKERLECGGSEEKRLAWLHRWSEADAAWIALNFNPEPASARFPLPPGSWRKELDSAEPRWGGAGSSLPADLAGGAERELALPPWGAALYTARAVR
jgi:maltooligosyltrehalose trehalohydrolase